MRSILYVIGVPGAGKTTALRLATADLATIAGDRPVKHRARFAVGGFEPRFVELGPERGTFSGTDGLGMSCQPRVIEWLTGPDAPSAVVAEGDRLANASFFVALEEAGWSVRLVCLDVDAETAEARRTARGSTQNETWLRGRRTKVERLAIARRAERIDGSVPREDVAAVIREMLP